MEEAPGVSAGCPAGCRSREGWEGTLWDKVPQRKALERGVGDVMVLITAEVPGQNDRGLQGTGVPETQNQMQVKSASPNRGEGRKCNYIRSNWC